MVSFISRCAVTRVERFTTRANGLGNEEVALTLLGAFVPAGTGIGCNSGVFAPTKIGVLVCGAIGDTVMATGATEVDNGPAVRRVIGAFITKVGTLRVGAGAVVMGASGGDVPRKGGREIEAGPVETSWGEESIAESTVPEPGIILSAAGALLPIL